LAFRSRKILFQLAFISALVLIAFNVIPSARADEWSQIPTVSIATVTGTPVGRSPSFAITSRGSSTYDRDLRRLFRNRWGVGGRLTGPGFRRSPGGEWIKIAYPGVTGGVAWIWVDLVDIRGNLPIVELPPTPLPAPPPPSTPPWQRSSWSRSPHAHADLYCSRAGHPPDLYSRASIGRSWACADGLILVVMTVVGLLGAVISFLGRR